MPDTYTITLPLPPKELSPNGRVYWAVLMRVKKKYRETAMILGRAARGRNRANWKTATAQCTFYFKENRRRDADNLLASMKAAFDGLRDAGIIEDDSGLTHMPVVVVVGSDQPRVEVVVTRG